MSAEHLGAPVLIGIRTLMQKFGIDPDGTVDEIVRLQEEVGTVAYTPATVAAISVARRAHRSLSCSSAAASK